MCARSGHSCGPSKLKCRAQGVGKVDIGWKIETQAFASLATSSWILYIPRNVDDIMAIDDNVAIDDIVAVDAKAH